MSVATEGEALERMSTYSLFSREWNSCYWVIQGQYLLIYPNKEMYERNPSGSKKSVKILPTMGLKEVEEKTYKGYGTLHKFVLDEEIDHGRSVVARFAAFTPDAAEKFYNAIKELIKDLQIEAGVSTQTESKESVRNARAAPSASGFAGMDR